MPPSLLSGNILSILDRAVGKGILMLDDACILRLIQNHQPFFPKAFPFVVSRRKTQLGPPLLQQETHG